MVHSCDLTRNRPLRRIRLSSIPRADLSALGGISIIDAKRRADCRNGGKAAIRRKHGTPFSQIARFQSEVVGNIDNESKDALDLFECWAGSTSQHDCAPKVFRATLDHGISQSHASFGKPAPNSITAIQNTFT